MLKREIQVEIKALTVIEVNGVASGQRVVRSIIVNQVNVNMGKTSPGNRNAGN